MNLQILFSLPSMYNCICILSFLGFKDTPFANFSSASHIFDNLRMLLIEIMHPKLALSMLCRYFPSKFCIFNLRKSAIADIVTQYPLSSLTSRTEPIHDLQKLDFHANLHSYYIFPIISTIEYPYFSAVAHPVPAGFSFCPSHSTYGAHPFKTYSYLSSTHA